MPGGFGTLDEFFEVLTLVQTQRIPEFPLILFGKEYWKGLLRWMKDRLEGKPNSSARATSTCSRSPTTRRKPSTSFSTTNAGSARPRSCRRPLRDPWAAGYLLWPIQRTGDPLFPVASEMYKLTSLPNGLRVATAEMPHMSSVSVGLWVGVGSRYEPAPLNGVCHFIEHLLFKGTTKRSAKRDLPGGRRHRRLSQRLHQRRNHLLPCPRLPRPLRRPARCACWTCSWTRSSIPRYRARSARSSRRKSRCTWTSRSISPGTAQRHPLAGPAAGPAHHRHRAKRSNAWRRVTCSATCAATTSPATPCSSRPANQASPGGPGCSRRTLRRFPARHSARFFARPGRAARTPGPPVHRKDRANPNRPGHPHLLAPRPAPLCAAPAQHDSGREHEFAPVPGGARRPRPGLLHLQPRPASSPTPATW